jgi:hypothetical protein
MQALAYKAVLEAGFNGRFPVADPVFLTESGQGMFGSGVRERSMCILDDELSDEMSRKQDLMTFYIR